MQDQRLKLIISLTAIIGLAGCAGGNVPSQAALDACSEQIGADTKFVVVTAADGSQSVGTSPAGQTIDLATAMELKACTDKFNQ